MSAAILVAAAKGDPSSLRALTQVAYESTSAPGVSKPLAYMEAITLARLTAAHGNPTDVRVIIYLLSEFAAFWSEQGEPALALHFEAQALHVAEAFAEDGDDGLADMVAAAADQIPECVHLEVRRLRELEAARCTER